MAVNITKLNPADIDLFRQLFHTVFGREMNAQMFQWKYIDNPCQTDNESYNVVVAKDGTRIIGARPSFAMSILYKGKRYHAAQPCDTMLLPDYRGSGLFSKMITYALNDLRQQGINYIFNFPNSNSYPGYIRNGWIDNGPVEAGIRVMSLKNTIVSRISKGKLKYAYTPDISPGKEFNISALAPSGAEELLCGTFNSSNYIAQYRSENWLNWRFSQCPNGKIYRFLAIKSENQLAGYAVLALTNSGAGEIVDYLVQGHDPVLFAELLRGSLQWFRMQGVRHVKTWYAHSSHRKVLNSHLFIPQKLKINHVFRCLDETPFTDAMWYLNMGDTDTH